MARKLEMFDYDHMESVIEGYFTSTKYWAGLDALTFMKRAHIDAKRKSSNLSYASHPILVAYIGVLLGLRPEIVTIGLLHDVTEDAHADFSTLPGGSVVQDAVKAITIMKLRPDESKAAVKMRYYGRMDENIYALINKLIDRMANLSSMVGALSHESIDKNIHETYEKLLPAVKRARRRKDDEYRELRDVMFVLQTILCSINEPLAILFNIDGVERKTHDIARTHARLEGRLEARDENGAFIYNQSDMALMEAYEATGKYQNGDLRPLRAMLLAAFTMALGIHDDNVIATVLLGDLLKPKMTCFNDDIRRAVRRLNPVKFEGETEEEYIVRAYTELSTCKEALIAKALYRWMEISYGQIYIKDDGADNGAEADRSLTDDEMRELILITDQHLIPALEAGRENFGSLGTTIDLLIIVLRMVYETIAAYKNIDLPSIRARENGQDVE